MNLQNWQKTVTVPMEVSDGETTQEYRLIFATCSNYDVALFNQRRAKAFEYCQERFGETWLDTEEGIAFFNTVIAHLVTLAGLKGFEMKEGDTWVQTDLPEAWQDYLRFPEEAPAGLLNTLMEAVFEAGNSARLFSLSARDDKEKKVLRLTVQP